VYCPACGGFYARFLPFNGRADARCPRCDSLERHRNTAAVLGELDLFAKRVLHVAPEWPLERRLRSKLGTGYVGGDLQPGEADVVLDLTNIAADDHSFDVVICSHVLEHIPDDRRALSEIRRVLAPGGAALLVVPYRADLTEIYEDPTVTRPEDRAREFGQRDHVRWYSYDGFTRRVQDAGFDLELSEAWSPGDAAVLARPS
jgi:SAM-dependent methyltransferase